MEKIRHYGKKHRQVWKKQIESRKTKAAWTRHSWSESFGTGKWWKTAPNATQRHKEIENIRTRLRDMEDRMKVNIWLRGISEKEY